MIALASDHGGFELMEAVKAYLESKGYLYEAFGAVSHESIDYPVVAVQAANAIVRGDCDKGIVICGTGVGVSIAANKVPGIRAALCTHTYMAEMARNHNDANVLALGGRVIDADLAIEIVDTFLTTEFSTDERHHRRVEMLIELDKR